MFTEEKIIIYCSQDEVKAFARGEIFADKIIGKKAFEFEYTDFEIRCDKPYKMTYDDFCYALKKFYKSYVDPGDFMYRWLEPLLSCFVDAVGLVNLIGEKKYNICI